MRRAAPLTRTIGLIVSALVVGACVSAPGPTPLPVTPSPAVTPGPSATVAPTAAPTARLGEVTDAVDATIAAGSARIRMVASFSGSSVIPEGTTFDGEGRTEFGEVRKLAMTMDLTVLGQGVVEMIIDDSIVYFRGPAFERFAPDGKWLRVDLESDHPAVAELKSVASGQNDASLALYYLVGATQATVLAPERIDGESMRHLGVAVDLEAAVGRLPARVSEMLRLNVLDIKASGIKPRLASEVWIDEAGRIRRVDHGYSLGAAQGGGVMTVEFHLSELGESIELALPAAANVVEFEDVVAG